ncbi:MAG: hypothetical protein BGO09_15895 [Bacteroidetes bacterium 47-18]|nr:MAG: hypothetical protein BGO09_15895 [Bacteroidetes bacterium 47-18]
MKINKILQEAARSPGSLLYFLVSVPYQDGMSMSLPGRYIPLSCFHNIPPAFIAVTLFLALPGGTFAPLLFVAVI